MFVLDGVRSEERESVSLEPTSFRACNAYLNEKKFLCSACVSRLTKVDAVPLQGNTKIKRPCCIYREIFCYIFFAYLLKCCFYEALTLSCIAAF